MLKKEPYNAKPNKLMFSKNGYITLKKSLKFEYNFWVIKKKKKEDWQFLLLHVKYIIINGTPAPQKTQQWKY